MSASRNNRCVTALVHSPGGASTFGAQLVADGWGGLDPAAMNTQIFSALVSDTGAFTWEQARRSGVSLRLLRQALASGRIRKLGHDLYSVALEPSNPRDRHVEILQAAVHRYGDRVMASEHSALIAHGLPTYDADLSQVSLLWRNNGSTRSTGPIRIRRTSFEFTPVIVNAIPTVSASSAFVQCASRFGLLSAVVAGDSMLHHGATNADELAVECKRLSRYRRSRVAIEAAAQLDERCESPGESVLRLLVRQAGIDLISQYEVFDGSHLIARADFLVAGTRVLIEFDGQVKYRSAVDLWNEKQREDRLRRLGYVIERVIWSEFDTPRALIARLRDAINRQNDATVVL